MRSGLPVLDEHMAVCVTSFPGFHVTTLCLPNVMLPDPCRIPIPLLNSLLLLLIRHLQYGTHFCANFILQVTNAQRPGNNTNLVHSLASVSYRRDWDSLPPCRNLKIINCLNSYNRIYNTITKYTIIRGLVYYS